MVTIEVDNSDVERCIQALRFRGQIECADQGKIKDALQGSFEAGNYRVILDFTDTGYLPGRVVGLLITFIEKIRACGGKIAIVATGEAMTSLTVVGAHRLLEGVFSDADSALALFEPVIRAE